MANANGKKRPAVTQSDGDKGEMVMHPQTKALVSKADYQRERAELEMEPNDAALESEASDDAA